MCVGCVGRGWGRKALPGTLPLLCTLDVTAGDVWWSCDRDSGGADVTLSIAEYVCCCVGLPVRLLHESIRHEKGGNGRVFSCNLLVSGRNEMCLPWFVNIRHIVSRLNISFTGRNQSYAIALANGK